MTLEAYFIIATIVMAASVVVLVREPQMTDALISVTSLGAGLFWPIMAALMVPMALTKISRRMMTK